MLLLSDGKGSPEEWTLSCESYAVDLTELDTPGSVARTLPNMMGLAMEPLDVDESHAAASAMEASEALGYGKSAIL